MNMKLKFLQISFVIFALLPLLSSFNTLAANDTYPIPQDKKIFDGTGTKGGRLVLTLTGNLESFNSVTSTTVSVSQVLDGPIFQNLIDYNLETEEVVPILARSIEYLNDGKTIRLKLRRGVHWSDGTPLTMEDVKFTYNLIMDESISAGARYILQQPDGTFPTIKYVDDETIEFSINKVNALFPASIGIVYILPKHKLEKAYKEGKFMQTWLLNTDPKEIVGTGPFVLDSYVPDQRVVLKRNPYYWKFDKNGVRLPYLNRIVRVIVPDKEAAFVKFQNGEIDMYTLQTDQYDLVKRNETKDNYTVTDLGIAYSTSYIMPNQNTGKTKSGEPFVEPQKLKLFSDRRFRQALSYAVDRDGIIQTIFLGRGGPLYTFTSPGNKSWYNPNIKTYPFDLEKAKSLLKEIGLKDSNGDGILEYPDTTKPIELTLKTNTESKERVQMANLVKEDLKKIGLQVNTLVLPFNSLVNTYKNTLDYDLILAGWGSGVPADPILSHNILKSNATGHYWNLNQKDKPATEWEKKIDELLVLNQTTMDMNKRVEYYHQILDIWAKELPQIMLASPKLYVAVKNHVGNVRPVPLRPYYEWNIDELYIKK